MTLLNITQKYPSEYKAHERRIQSHDIVLYMKGTLEQPLCGFSDRVVRILHQCGVHFEPESDSQLTKGLTGIWIDVLTPDQRSILKEITQWPTFPQLYIKGNFIGGCDIVSDLYAKGELQKQLAELSF
jgi:monothiol glutaredoxin